MKRTFLAALSGWRIAPPTVKWTTPFLAVIILYNLVPLLSGIWSTIDLYLHSANQLNFTTSGGNMPADEMVRPYLLALIVPEALLILILGLFLAATVGLLLKRSWARIALQIFAWIMFSLSCLVFVHFLREPIRDGNAIHAFLRDAGFLVWAITFLVVIFALRTRATRQYCSDARLVAKQSAGEKVS